MTKISVIIPVYNVENYLRECLDSVINQTLKDIEIICVDDGSTDNSREILDEYSRKDKRIKLIIQENQGLSCARNNAMQIATGEYISCIDSDDYIREDAYEILYNKAKNYNLDMLSFAGINFDNKTKKKLDSHYHQFKYLPKNFNIDCFNYKDCYNFITKMAVTSCLTIYRFDFIKSNNIKFPVGLCFEDNFFFTKAIFNAKKCGISKEVLYYRRVHNASITQNWAKKHSDFIKISELILDYLKSINVDSGIYEKYNTKYSRTVIRKYNKFPKEYKKQYYESVTNFIQTYNPKLLNKIKSPRTFWDILISKIVK